MRSTRAALRSIALRRREGDAALGDTAGWAVILSRFQLAIVLGMGALTTATSSHAQAPINSNVALRPSTGGVIIRQQLRYFEAGEVKAFVVPTTILYGLRDDLTLILTTPVVFREVHDPMTGETRRDSGVADLTFLTKFRVFRDDFGPTETRRLSLLGGLEIRSGDTGFTSDSYDPIFGGVFTHAEGRHAFDADLLWKFNTAGGAAGADQMKYDVAYLYRLAPEQYTSSKLTALFGVLELNGQYDTNGDHELFVSPGISYVTKRWTLEGTVQLPIVQELDHRLARDFVVGLSFRIRF